MYVYRTTSLVALLFLTGTCVAQTKEITSDEFWNRLSKARTDISKLNHREIRKAETIKKGKVTNTSVWDSTYQMPNRSRVIHTETTGKRTTRTESITIGESKFCRKNNGPWEIFEDCRGNTGGGSWPVSSRHTVEVLRLNKRRATLYTEYLEFGTEKDRTYHEFKYWLDYSGKVIGEFDTQGSVQPKSITYRMKGTFDYHPKGLKIEAPVRIEAPARITK